MKKVLKLMLNNILLVTIAYTVIFLFLKLIINLIGWEYRQWVYIVTLAIILIGIVAGIIQIIFKTKNEILKAILVASFLIVITLCIVISPFIFFVGTLVFVPEHTIEKDERKLVANVHGFLDTYVDYYDDINIFIRGKNKVLREDYGSGGFDPLVGELAGVREVKNSTYYDENGEVIISSDDNNEQKETTQNIQSNIDTEESSNSEQTEYIFWINEKEGKKVSIESYAMGKEAIRVYTTNNGGITWKSMIKTENGALWVHYNSKFLFINQYIGFIYDPGGNGKPDDYGKLMVTTDGGESYTDCKIEHPTSIEEKNIIIEGLPTYEDEELKLKVYTLNHAKNPSRTYYEYITEDKGLNWKYKGKIDK